MKILMPWKQNGRYYTRCEYKTNCIMAKIEKENLTFRVRRVDTKTPPKHTGWLYAIYKETSGIRLFGIYNIQDILYNGEIGSKEEAMKIVDDYLTKLEYRLLNEGDKLLSLI